MLQRDYFLRIIQEFMAALAKFLEKKEAEEQRDDDLRELYRQYVGDSASFDVQLTRKAPSHESSLDNMGAVITVFNY